MSKLDNLSGRLQLRVLPEILSDLDYEQARLRNSGFMFGNRKPKHAAIVMTALKAFLTLTPSQRDEFYEKFLPQFEETVQKDDPVTPLIKAVPKNI